MPKWLDSFLRGVALWLVVDSPIRFGRFAPAIFGYGIGAKPHRIEDDEDNALLGLVDDPDA
jgi:hypothetical protein